MNHGACSFDVLWGPNLRLRVPCRVSVPSGRVLEWRICPRWYCAFKRQAPLILCTCPSSAGTVSIHAEASKFFLQQCVITSSIYAWNPAVYTGFDAWRRTYCGAQGLHVYVCCCCFIYNGSFVTCFHTFQLVWTQPKLVETPNQNVAVFVVVVKCTKVDKFLDNCVALWKVCPCSRHCVPFEFFRKFWPPLLARSWLLYHMAQVLAVWGTCLCCLFHVEKLPVPLGSAWSRSLLANHGWSIFSARV